MDGKAEKKCKLTGEGKEEGKKVKRCWCLACEIRRKFEGGPVSRVTAGEALESSQAWNKPSQGKYPLVKLRSTENQPTGLV